MSKNVSWWILISIFLFVFDIVFFISVEDVSDSQWVSMFFLHVSYLLVVFSSMLLKNKKIDVVLGYPIVFLSTAYFSLTFILSLVLIVYNAVQVKTVFIFHLIVMGIYLILLFSNIFMNQNTKHQRETQQTNLAFIKESILSLEDFKVSQHTKNIKHKIDEIVELLRYGQTVSNEKTIYIEQTITLLIHELVKENDVKDIADKLQTIEEQIKRREVILKSTVMKNA